MGWFVIVAIVLWIWWANRRDPPRPVPTQSLTPMPAPPPPLAPDAEQTIKTADDIPLCEVETNEDECAVCQSTRKARFVTPRIRLCQWCVSGLNDHAPFDVVALARVVESYRRPDENAENYWEAVLAGVKNDWTIERAVQHFGLRPRGMSTNFWRKVLRGYQLGLISGGAACSRLPDEAWTTLTREIRNEDGWRCVLCGAHHQELHVHHIIHLHHYGTHARMNLVTLCYPCHRRQHPDIYFSRDAPFMDDEMTI